jgi:hypothetical protein
MLRHLMTLAPEGSHKKQLLSLLIFPEGTDLSDINIAKSNMYAKEKDLPERKYVLYPKSTGEMVSM